MSNKHARLKQLVFKTSIYHLQEDRKRYYLDPKFSCPSVKAHRIITLYFIIKPYLKKIVGVLEDVENLKE